MDYFSKFLRSGNQSAPKPALDRATEFHKSWTLIKNTLTYPDERQLARGIQSTDVPTHLKSMVDSLVWESTRTEEGVTGACLEYLLKNDVLGSLVSLSEPDRPAGIQVEVLRSVQNMIVLLDEQFLVHSAVHRAVLKLLKTCIGDDIHEQLDGRAKVMGAAGTAVRSQPSEYEEDLVDLLCILCSRIRTYRELLMIFFYDKHWFHSDPLPPVMEEVDEEDVDEKPDNDYSQASKAASIHRSESPTPSQVTVTSAPTSSATRKTEYEFVVFNYLLRFVHREGKIGDFARAGLLFLMDVAMSPGEPIHRLGGDDALASTSSLAEAPQSDPITEAALAFAEYILDGDFSEVLAAGLGAVYSLLPSKLDIRPDVREEILQGTGMVIGVAVLEAYEDQEKMLDFKAKEQALGLERSTNAEFKSRLDHFLKLVEFLEDVLRRNVSHEAILSSLDPSSLVGSAIVHAILDAVRRIFLKNVLYTSILECSDCDGSAVAVMSYIDIVIRTLQGGQLSDMLIDFLLSDDDSEISRYRPRMQPTILLDPAPSKARPDRDVKLNRRKSSAMLLLEMEAPDAKRQSEYLTSMGRFTLKDLLLANLRSTSQPAITAALQMIQSLLTHHCPVTVDRLFLVIHDTTLLMANFVPPAIISDPEDDEETFVYPGGADAEPTPRIGAFSHGSVLSQPETTYAAHEEEMRLYLDLASRVDPSHVEDCFSTGYDHYLRDAITSIQSHSCYLFDGSLAVQGRDRHQFNPNDPILSLILQFLRRFFSNSPETNIVLTGVLATMALCRHRSLSGWLIFGSDHSQPSVSNNGLPAFGYEDDGDDRSVDFGVEERLTSQPSALHDYTLKDDSRPVLYSILHGLVSRIDRYREVIPNFDKFLVERRQGLLFSENLNDALNLYSVSSIATSKIPSSGLVPSSAPDSPVQWPKHKSKPSTWSTLLTPKKSRLESKVDSAHTEPRTPRGGKVVAASPFGPHYQKTTAIIVEPFIAPAPTSGLWTPKKAPTLNAEEQDVFGSHVAWKDDALLLQETSHADSVDDELEATKRVTLSQILDNVVILEESIKELAAILHARRSLGIDSIRYL